MEAAAFCPAHVTGFFKVYLGNGHGVAGTGSVGAGFSIKHGVTTTVRVRTRKRGEPRVRITASGYKSENTDVSRFVLDEFLRIGSFSDRFFDVRHEITVPVGYGLGSSGAVALSMAYAMDRALGTGLDRTRIGEIAHSAEVACQTGLGDVLASFHGGFEIRLKPGAPGTGAVQKMPADGIMIVMVCFSPISTQEFIKERLPRINGIGKVMVDRLQKSQNCGDFQDMSLEFARHIDVMTPRMQSVADRLSQNGIKCGVALFGETVFSMIARDEERRVLDILREYPEGIVIRTELDDVGARVVCN